jgi:hypothetical protein
MPYPRGNCPVCDRETAIAPRTGRHWRHDPPVRDPELRSCRGSHSLYQPSPGEPGYMGDQGELFDV